MAGNLAFINGMAPGISSMMRSLVDESAAAKGYKAGTDARKSYLEGNKLDQEMRFGAEDRTRQQTGMVQNIAGMHGVDPRAVQAVIGGGDTSSFNLPPDVLNALRRDAGAFMHGKPTDVSSYHTATTKLPGERAQAGAAAELFKMAQQGGPVTDQMRTLSAVQSGGQMHAPQQENEKAMLWRLWQDPKMRPQVEAFMQANKNPATQINMPNASHYGADPKTGRPGMFQIGRSGETIFTPIDPAPSSDPIKNAVAAAMKTGGQPGGQPGSKAAPQPAPPQAQRNANTVYDTPKGPLLWTGKGWVSP